MMRFIKTIDEVYINISTIVKLGIDSWGDGGYHIYVTTTENMKYNVDEFESYASAERMLEALLDRIGGKVVYG